MLHRSWFPPAPPYFNVVLCPHASRARMGVYFYRPDVLFQWSWHQHWNWGSKGDHHQIIWRWAFILATPVAHNRFIYPTKCAVRHCAALHDTVRHCVALYDNVRHCTELYGLICLFVCMFAAGALLDGRFRVLLAPGTTCALLVGRFITAIMKNRAMRRAQITTDLRPHIWGSRRINWIEIFVHFKRDTVGG